MRRLTMSVGTFAPVLLILLIGNFRVSAQDMTKAKDWTADPGVLKRLGKAVEVEGYTIQLPRGFEAQEIPAAPDGMKLRGWAGNARRDGSRPSITMNVLMPPPSEMEKMKTLPLEQLAEKLVGGIQRRRTNWKQEKPEKGNVNGIEFVRIRWEGADPTKNRNMRGFLYVSRDDNKILQLASQDFSPDLEKVLTLTEASILTFKKK